MKRIVLIIGVVLSSFSVLLSQDDLTTDSRPIVGVSPFTCDKESSYKGLVAESVVQALMETKRFQVVDRTSKEAVDSERELGKTEAAMYSNQKIKAINMLIAESMVIGHISKIPIIRLKNPDGSVNGFKASIAFTLKIEDVSTGITSDGSSFEGKTDKVWMTPEAAVTDAMLMVKADVVEYIKTNFSINGKVVKILNSSGGAATRIQLNIGKKQGVSENNKFIISYIEMRDGKPLPVSLGEATVIELQGEDFADCKVSKKDGTDISLRFNAGTLLNAKLVVSSKK